MKKSLLLLAVAVLSAQSVYADWVVVQKSETAGATENTTIKIKGDKTRMDVGQKMTIIADGATGDMLMLMHEQKVAMKMDAATIKSAMGAMAASGAPAAKPTATGEKEKVGEYDTEVYTWTGAIGSGKFWVAKDFPNYKELNDSQEKLMKAMGPAAAMMPQANDFPGMVVKSEMQVQGNKSTSELVSAKEEAVDEAVFKQPEGYQEMKMPTAPAGN